MKPRKRLRLVPNNCVEQFEVRFALYFGEDGNSTVTVEVTDISGTVEPAFHEIAGAFDLAKDALKDQYYPR